MSSSGTVLSMTNYLHKSLLVCDGVLKGRMRMLYAVLFIISFTISVSVALVKRDNLSNITDVLDNSEPFYYVIYACIAITLPGIADGIFELLAPAPQEINATERIILLLSIVAPSVYAGILRFLPNTDTLQEACMYSVMKIMQKCVMIAVFLIIVVRRNEQYFRPSVATLAYILLCFAQTLRSCFLYGGVPGILGVCSSIAIWTSFGIMLTLCLRFWAFLAYNRTSKLTSENIITCFVTVLAAVVIVAINALDLALQQSTWDQYDYRDLLYGNLIFTICTLWLVTLPNYISRLLLSESQRRLEMKRLFVRHVSHEIRTPLNIATVGLSLLSKLTSREGRPDDDDDEKATAAESIMQEQMDLISEVQESCRVAVSIIDDLLAYEKLDAGLLLLDSSLENVCAFIRATSALFSIQARGKEIDFRVLQNIDCIEETSSFLIDKGKMAQVVRNLISNALKFSPGNGVVCIEAVRSTLPDGKASVLIKVVDSGVGIEKADLGKLFRDIVQFNPNENQGGGGSGLGLWVSSKIIDLHGGLVSVHSEGIGRGCTFAIELPLSIERPSSPSVVVIEESSGDEARLKLQTDSGRLRGMKQHQVRPFPVRSNYQSSVSSVASRRLVLVVDDSALNRKMTSRLLHSMGYATTEAEDGVECLRIVEESFESGHNIFAIVIDNLMPNLAGPDATRLLRSRGYTGAIIGLTGNALEEDVLHFQLCGADEVLCKPMDEEKIAAALECYGQDL